MSPRPYPPTCDRDRDPFDIWWGLQSRWLRAGIVLGGLFGFILIVGLAAQWLGVEP